MTDQYEHLEGLAREAADEPWTATVSGPDVSPHEVLVAVSEGRDWPLIAQYIHAVRPQAILALIAENRALKEALTPSGDTKAAYHGEFKFSMTGGRENEDGEWEEFTQDVPVPWTTVKEIMAAMSARAALNPVQQGGQSHG